MFKCTRSIYKYDGILFEINRRQKYENKGKCIAIIQRTNDNDDKLIVVPEDKNYSNDAIEALVEFQERYFEHKLIMHERN